ncbi:DUF7344 domain-containing protein [Halosegnis marinus]|uniref:DUF7344 domain-containing protein n=1 Tax=Halosegnis marinus TaxID=3034023 RepID=A0ABD5ZQZ6_9EURY|nr:hypothetical protein [Halosegnis sp. DT85]
MSATAGGTAATEEPSVGEPEESAPADLTPDETFELLSNHRRRYAIHHLKRVEDTDIGGLSRQIAAWENDTEPAEVTSAERKRVYTSLQQFHLPKLDEKGVVEFDERAGEVALSDAAENLDLYLEVVQGKDIPWSQYYLGLAAVNVGLLAAVGANAWPFVLLPDLAWGVFAVTTLAISAAVHTYYNHSMQLGRGESPPAHDA